MCGKVREYRIKIYYIKILERIALVEDNLTKTKKNQLKDLSMYNSG